MSTAFDGVINLDVRDSTPDWAPYLPPQAPEGSANVVYIVWDDAGSGRLRLLRLAGDRDALDGPPGRHGRPVHAVAHDGAVLADPIVPADRPQLPPQRHGRHRRGRQRLPGRERSHPAENGTLAEILRDRGYSTYAVGKWHMSPETETHQAAPRRTWPTGRGFERYYGFLGGETKPRRPVVSPARSATSTTTPST